MNYKEGDFLLINDESYKAKQFIGEIAGNVNNNKKNDNDQYTLLVYIFPEDTKDGKQSYMSSSEVFLTTNQKTYFLDGIVQDKVEVVTLDEYINRKYNRNEKCPNLYFKRQDYNIEKNLFYPEELPRICICEQIFNPDIPFFFF